MKSALLIRLQKVCYYEWKVHGERQQKPLGDTWCVRAQACVCVWLTHGISSQAKNRFF